jgi:uncharacterized protein (TIGR00645 family)
MSFACKNEQADSGRARYRIRRQLELVIVLFLYGVAYLRGIFSIIIVATILFTENMEIIALNFVGVVMVTDLLKMIIRGSYNSFASKDHGRQNENIGSGTLKKKISTSIVVVCSSHLLRNFVADRLHWRDILTKLWLITAFPATAVVLGILKYMHVKSEMIETQIKHRL